LNPGSNFTASYHINNPNSEAMTIKLGLKFEGSDTYIFDSAEKTAQPGDNTFEIHLQVPSDAIEGTYDVQWEVHDASEIELLDFRQKLAYINVEAIPPFLVSGVTAHMDDPVKKTTGDSVFLWGEITGEGDGTVEYRWQHAGPDSTEWETISWSEREVEMINGIAEVPKSMNSALGPTGYHHYRLEILSPNNILSNEVSFENTQPMTPSVHQDQNDFYYSPGDATGKETPLGDRIPLILIHGDGGDKRPFTNNRWVWWINFLNTKPYSDYFKVYRYVYETDRSIIYNGTVIIDFINNWEEFKNRRVLLLAHSMGGLVSRYAMNNDEFGNKVINLITLGTPHLGSPAANPPWIGACILSPINFISALLSTKFFGGNEGDFDLSWYSTDDILTEAFEDIPKYSKWPWHYDDLLLENAMNFPLTGDMQTQKYTDKIIAFAGDRRGTIGNIEELSILGPADDFEETKNDHSHLFTSFLALTQVYKKGGDFFWHNDGLVPLESAMFETHLEEDVNAFNLSKETYLNKVLDHTSFLDDPEVHEHVGEKLINIAQNNTSPLTPLPTSPVDGSFLGTLLPVFEWSSFQDGGDQASQAGYQLRVRCDTDDNIIVYDTGFISDTSGNLHQYQPGAYSGTDPDPVSKDLMISEPLEWNKHYHWHVRYRDSSGDWSEWSADQGLDSQQNFYTLCEYVLSQNNEQYNENTGSGNFDVSASDGCVWSAMSDESWITIISGSSGKGDGTVNYTVDSNPNIFARNGSIIIEDQIFTVFQSGISCSYDISPSSHSFDSSGGTESIDMSAHIDCSWSASSKENWITVTSGEEGIGEGTVNYTVDSNPDSSNRSGQIAVADQLFSVFQSGAVCNYKLSPNSRSFEASGGIGDVDVMAPGGCTWNALSSSPWITVTSGTTGNGDGTISYTVDPNPGSSNRNGSITIADQVFTISQFGIACSYSLSSDSQNVDASESSSSFAITAPEGCSWTAVADDNWISITSGSSGTGNGTVNFLISSNLTANQRTGSINVESQTFTVTQEGVTCSYSISPTDKNMGGTFGTGTIDVVAPEGCPWEALSNDAWITITSGASGNATGTVGFSVEENSGENQRTGTISIAGHSFTITQLGDGLIYHSGDFNPADWSISEIELQRMIELYQAESYHCNPGGADGYGPGEGDQTCEHHSSDYKPADWKITLPELLRAIQIYNIGSYSQDSSGEDGYSANR
jgi:pimeloyl-ACP methyl ester carboxylesterase